ncbi:hypothetical protein Bint_2387 [Brachyspira intermedia PWS/A]|uniref:Surface antigen BspA like protein n=1 Tax=Brachyspira intermedia (strain ATCC 51140 / PWS/A) TaxID=1045858 RepID=G0EMV2_BRAIP|nr:leucine-rich repeat domain-containing protein [Brachyspira intermedia]AEM22993.1 hypothetical protein Bint_2387 [Brachyspira intermedia PWS/A]
MKKMINNIIFIVLIAFVYSCNNSSTNPSSNNPIEAPIENVTDYIVKANTTEADIEAKMKKYFEDKGSYAVFLEDTKENIANNKTLEIINTIIKKDVYTKDGVYLDLSRTTITELADNVFNGNRNLNKITLPNTITTIGGYAFRDCSSLREINFPSSITQIKGGAFQSCLSLHTADLSQTKLTVLEPYLFNDCSSLIKAVIPETVVDIKNNSFGDCSALKEINLPSKLIRMYPESFVGCKSLEKISLPSTLIYMYGYTFGECASLKDVEYLGNNPATIKVANGAVFDGYTENSTPVNLYLPNVTADPKDGSWNNFLGYDWSKQTINYGKTMPK